MNNDVEIAKSFAYKQNQTHARPCFICERLVNYNCTIILIKWWIGVNQHFSEGLLLDFLSCCIENFKMNFPNF